VITDDDGSTEGWDGAADEWLVRRARGGDVDAYEVLVRRHRRRIFRIALRMLGDRDEAEDVTQDVVIQVWLSLTSFSGASAFTTWLYRIVVNRCLNRVRRMPVTRPVLDDDPPAVAGAEETVIANERLLCTCASRPTTARRWSTCAGTSTRWRYPDWSAHWSSRRSTPTCSCA
jgi:DNA-directed RNA polymerase specialized sigma24 family protein